MIQNKGNTHPYQIRIPPPHDTKQSNPDDRESPTRDPGQDNHIAPKPPHLRAPKTQRGLGFPISPTQQDPLRIPTQNRSFRSHSPCRHAQEAERSRPTERNEQINKPKKKKTRGYSSGGRERKSKKVEEKLEGKRNYLLLRNYIYMKK